MLVGQTVAGILGNITAIFLFLSPLPTFLKIAKKRSTQDFSGLPYACTMLQCALWTFYGSPWVEWGLLVVTINGFGATLEFVFLMIFVVFAASKPVRVKILIVIGCALGALGLVVALNMTLTSQKDLRRNIVGVIAAVFCTSMYASPLSIVRTVIKTKSTQFMPFFLSLFIFINSATWSIYALIGHDIYIGIPSAIGTCLGVIQLGLYARYCRGGSGEVLKPQVAVSKFSEKDAEAVGDILKPQYAVSKPPEKDVEAAGDVLKPQFAGSKGPETDVEVGQARESDKGEHNNEAMQAGWLNICD